MPALATLPAAASTDIDGEFLHAPPPLGVAAALAAVTVTTSALVVFAVGEIAGRYAARPRGGVR